MILDSLEELEDEELRAVAARCQGLLRQHDQERKEKALCEARATLAAAGLSVKDLVSKGRERRARAPHYKGGRTYRHPVRAELVWNAKGQKPNWLRALEAEGKMAIEMEATATRPSGK